MAISNSGLSQHLSGAHNNDIARKELGRRGENAAIMFLVKHGFSVLEHNYRRKYGEIDIVAEKGGYLHFIEVKSVSRETYNFYTNSHRAIENVSPQKLHKIQKTALLYISEKGFHEKPFQIDVVIVEFVSGFESGLIEMIPNVM